jgi:hypothetical protein
MLNNRKRLLMLVCAITTLVALSCICFGDSLVAAAPTVYDFKAVENVATAETDAPVVALNNSPLTFDDFIYKVFYDIELSTSYIAELQECIKALDAAICPNEYTETAMAAMNVEKARLQDIVTAVNSDIELYTRWEQEHYYAAKTYEFLRQNGYSAEVACGIIGNMMIETSGCTLDLKPTIYSPGGSFYGLCQWSRTRRPKNADGSDGSFETQLLYLHEDIPVQFKAFGKTFKTSHEKFLALKDPAKVALIFAKVYERCDSSSYGARQRAANIAYRYFTNEA